MKQMKTLTVNGVTYAVHDPTAARVDDSILGDAPWSAKKIVDKLCPAFAQTGTIVTCEPVEGYPLDVVSQIVFVQEGSGTPSSDNIRPIQGCSGANLTHNDAAFSVDFGETVYGGTYNWTTGLLTITNKMVALTPDMGWIMTGDKNPNGIKSFYTGSFDANARDDDMKNSSVSSHYRVYEGGWSVNSVSYAQAIKVLNNRIYIADARFHDLASFKAFIEANEVQLLYQLISPVTVQLSAQEFLGLAGENTFHSDTGDTTVTGRADPIAINKKTEERLAALEAALVNA